MALQPDVDADRHWTVSDYRSIDDDERYEIIEGDLQMVPSPNNAHQRIATRLGSFLDMHVMENDLGECRDAPFDVVLSEQTVVQPDFLFVERERVSEVLDEQGANAAPDLVVEILSPSSARRDRIEKRRVYADFGVRWFVLVDPEERLVECFRLSDDGEYVYDGGAAGDEHLEIGLFPDLEIPLGRVWPEN